MFLNIYVSTNAMLYCHPTYVAVQNVIIEWREISYINIASFEDTTNHCELKKRM